MSENKKKDEEKKKKDEYENDDSTRMILNRSIDRRTKRQEGELLESSSPNSDILKRAIHEHKWSRELWRLNSELAETFEVLLIKFLDYCKENNIPLQNMDAIKNMLARIETLFNQIAELDNPNFKMDFIRRKVTEDKSDDKVTEP